MSVVDTDCVVDFDEPLHHSTETAVSTGSISSTVLSPAALKSTPVSTLKLQEAPLSASVAEGSYQFYKVDVPTELTGSLTIACNVSLFFSGWL